MWGFIVKIIVVGRTMPTESTGSIGLFEHEQAKALSDHFDITYLFIDNQSIKKNKKIKRYYDETDFLTLGIYLPIGGLYRKLFDKLKYYMFKKTFEKYISIKGRPDIVHFHFPLLTANKDIIKYVKNQNIQIICTEHWSKVMKKELNKNEKSFLNYYMENCSCVTAVSENLKKSMMSYNDQIPITVIPNYVNSHHFSLLKNTEKKHNHFFTVGRLVQEKNIELSISGIDFLVNEKKLDVYLHIIGEGPHRSFLEKKVSRLGLQKHVFFEGSIKNNELASIISEYGCYISTSPVETFGVPVVESLLIGVPVIISKSHSLAEYINDSNGKLFDLRVEDDFYQNIYEIYLNSRIMERNKISNEAKKIFGSNVIKKSWVNTYETITSEELK